MASSTQGNYAALEKNKEGGKADIIEEWNK